MTDEEKTAKLEAIYARIPKMRTCAGKCEDSCTAVPITPFERERIEKELHRPFECVKKDDGTYRCSALVAGRCSVYEIRPLLCRMFGTSRHPFLKCQYGCEPERWLSGQETIDLLLEVQELCGPMDTPHNPYCKLTQEQLEAAAVRLLLENGS